MVAHRYPRSAWSRPVSCSVAREPSELRALRAFEVAATTSAHGSPAARAALGDSTLESLTEISGLRSLRVPQRRAVPSMAQRLAAALQGAERRGEMSLAYQALVDLQTGGISGFEALMRWTHPKLGAVDPSDFIPVAERTGAIVPLGQWAIATAFDALGGWRSAAPELNLSIAVNVAPEQLLPGSCRDQVLAALWHAEIPPDAATLEISERTLSSAGPSARVALDELRELGVALSIDDVGRGFSSLRRLRSSSIDEVKIDRSCVSRIETDDRQRSRAAEIVELGAELGVRVVAEGIETEQQRGVLAAMGCELGQGFLLERPLPAASVPELLLAGARGPD